MNPSMRAPILCLLGALLAPAPCAAQEASWDYAGGDFGGSDFHVRDEHASPSIFSAWGIAPSLRFIHAGEDNRQYFEASYYSAFLATARDNFRTDNWRGRGRYAYLRLIGSAGGGSFKLFVGGSLSSFLDKSNYYYFIRPLNGYSTSIVSWYWTHSLDAAVTLEYGLREREFLSLQCFFPLLSNVSRPQYSPSSDYSYTENVFKMKMFGRTEFFPKNLSCDVALALQVPLLWMFNGEVRYEFYYASYDLPREMKLYMNNFRGGIYFCF